MDPTEWLMENAGPVIRYRTAHEILGEPVIKLEEELLNSILIQKWLGYLKPYFGASQLHNAKSEAFENTMGKLFDFGLRSGMNPLDKQIAPFLEWLKSKGGHWFSRILVSGFLCMTGYSNEESVDMVVQSRLQTVYDYVKHGDLNEIYIDTDSIRSIPVNFRGRPIINPDLMTENGFRLPCIHDIQGFLNSEPVMKDKMTRARVEKIVEFILSDEYQSLYPGYGVGYEPENRSFYSMGWSLHLVDYFEEHPYGKAMEKSICIDHSNLLRLSLLSSVKKARETSWFRKSLEKLKQFGAKGGFYRFPRNMLRELGSGYWVSGRRMGLELNRRSSSAVTAESTFRVLEIRSKGRQEDFPGSQ